MQLQAAADRPYGAQTAPSFPHRCQDETGGNPLIDALRIKWRQILLETYPLPLQAFSFQAGDRARSPQEAIATM